MPAQRFHLSCGNGFQDFKSLVKPGFSILSFYQTLPYGMAIFISRCAPMRIEMIKPDAWLAMG
jgi:hypothetical protein